MVPSDTPLIRLTFDINDTLEARNPKRIRLEGLRTALHHHMVRCGLRQTEHPTEESTPRRVRKEIALTNGFRKHVISTFIDCNLNYAIREMISNHDTHLDANYYRPSEDQILQQYLLAEPYLTVDPSMRLAQENQTLKIEKSKMELLEQRMAEYDKVLGLA